MLHSIETDTRAQLGSGRTKGQQRNWGSRNTLDLPSREQAVREKVTPLLVIREDNQILD
jgi:hypothetical protein